MLALVAQAWPIAALYGLAGLGFALEGPGLRRGAAAVLVALAMTMPWLLPPSWIFVRGFSALTATLAAGRLIDLWRDPKPFSISRRLWHAFGIVDTRRVRPLPSGRRLSARLPRSLVFVVIFAFAMFLVLFVAPWLRASSVSGSYVVRWIGAALGMASVAEVVFVSPDFVYSALGLDAGPLHAAPEKSRSLAEFWGQRWNRVIGIWLAESCFRPLARRGMPRAAQLAAFLASAVLHFYFTWVAIGAFWAAMMASYFVVQGALVLVEASLRVRRWPRWASHLWAWAGVLLPGPLIFEPTLRVAHLLP